MTSVRQFLNAFQRCTSYGWLDWDEALLLVSYADQTQGPIVEVGSYMGRSASLLRQLGGGRDVICVDPWDDHFHSDLSGDEIYSRFLQHVGAFTEGSVTPVRKKVEDWDPVPAELVYLDGDHTFEGTCAQIQQALKCRPKFILIHDVTNGGGGLEVRNAALQLLGRWDELVGKMAAWKIGGAT